MMYFIYQLSRNNRQKCSKTSSTSKESALENIRDFELCSLSEIKIKEIPLSMFSFPTDQLWKLYDKPFILKMINRRAVKILGYASHGTRIEYVDTGQECTVHASVIKEYNPKTKKFKN